MTTETTTYTYDAQIDGGQGGSDTIEAPDIATALAEAIEWAREGDWPDEGCSVDVSVSREADGESAEETIDIEPNHEALIRSAVGHYWLSDICGTDPGDHEWTSDGEGGLDGNPGVWSTGGTTIVTHSHCRRCGLQRVETSRGSQRNPGEHDTVAYTMADDDQIARWRAAGDMDNEPACEHPRLDGDTCTECGETCTHADVGADDDGICHDPDCPIHRS